MSEISNIARAYINNRKNALKKGKKIRKNSRVDKQGHLSAYVIVMYLADIYLIMSPVSGFNRVV